MTTGTKVFLGLGTVALLFGTIGIGSIISINNSMVGYEKTIEAQYKQNQNNYDSMTKKVLEVAQVPAMATADLEKLTKAAISGRYGAKGSQAVFQFIKEQNPTIGIELYTKIQHVIEASRSSFEADQKTLIDKKRVYTTELEIFPSGYVAKFLGYPKIDLSKYDIVTSDETEEAFKTKKSKPMKLRE